MIEENKPEVQLSGNDGNAFVILGLCQRAARNAKWSKDRIAAFTTEAKSGNYDNLLAMAMKYFEVM